MRRTNHNEALEAKDAFINDFVEQTMDEDTRWMAVFWTVKDGMLTMKRKTTWRFPEGDYDAAVKHLQDRCDEEKGPKPPQPLDSADVISLQQIMERRRRGQPR